MRGCKGGREGRASLPWMREEARPPCTPPRQAGANLEAPSPHPTLSCLSRQAEPPRAMVAFSPCGIKQEEGYGRAPLPPMGGASDTLEPLDGTETMLFSTLCRLLEDLLVRKGGHQEKVRCCAGLAHSPLRSSIGELLFSTTHRDLGCVRLPSFSRLSRNT